jgi:hypothetical protein
MVYRFQPAIPTPDIARPKAGTPAFEARPHMMILNKFSGEFWSFIGYQTFAETYEIILFVSDFLIELNDIDIGTAYLEVDLLTT